MRFPQQLNKLHLAATLRTGRQPFVVSCGCREVFWSDRRRGGALRNVHNLQLRSGRQQLADAREFGLPIAVGKKAVMADALEPVGQDVEQKAADELGRRERHELVPRSVGVVLPGEGDAFVADRDQAVIGNGDAVRIAAQVTQNLLGAGKGLLAVDHPIEPPERAR